MPQLDGLRAVSVLAVVYTHYLDQRYWLFGVYWGIYGVFCFFVISGFLITTLILQHVVPAVDRGIAFRRFLLQRYFRLTPLLVATLVLGYLANIEPVRRSWPWHITYLSDIYFTLRDQWDGPVSPYWSLSVEEQFYILWPIALIACRARYWPLILALIPAAILFRFVWPRLGMGELGLYILPPACFDALGLGAMLAVLRRDLPLTQTITTAVGAAGAGLLLACILFPDVLDPFGLRLTAASMIFLFIVQGCARNSDRYPWRLLVTCSPFSGRS